MTKDNIRRRSAYISPWANLADAVLCKGTADNDKIFLESDWAETLRMLCKLDDEMNRPSMQFNGTKICKEKSGNSYDDL